MESLIGLNENKEDASGFWDVVRSKPRGENNGASNKSLERRRDSVLLMSCPSA